MPTSTTPASRYLRPWSVVDEEELSILRQIRSLVDDLSGRFGDEIVYFQYGGVLRVGDVGALVRRLQDMGK